jgi:uncharacterized membrane protein YfcA
MIFSLLLLGFLSGILAGIVGIGGGIVIVPVLIYLLGYSQHKAQGTSLGALLLPIGILACWEYYKAGNMDVKAALLIAAGFALGGWLGGMWAQHIPELMLRRIFATVLILIGIKMLLQR